MEELPLKRRAVERSKVDADDSNEEVGSGSTHMQRCDSSGNASRQSDQSSSTSSHLGGLQNMTISSVVPEEIAQRQIQEEEATDANRPRRTSLLAAHPPIFAAGTSLASAYDAMRLPMQPPTVPPPNAAHSARTPTIGSSSAASMLRAASAFAAEASSSPASLQAISSALMSASSSAPGQSFQSGDAHTGSPGSKTPQNDPQRLSGTSSSNTAVGTTAAPSPSAQDYASSMSAHISQAIARQQAAAAATTDHTTQPASSSQARVLPTVADASLLHGTGSQGDPLGAEFAARVEMTNIAVRAAAQEAQAQGLVQEMIRQNAGPTGGDSTTTQQAEAAQGRSGKISPSSPLASHAIDSYLSNLGLAHSQIPLAAPASAQFASSSTMPTNLSVPVPSSVAASVPFHAVTPSGSSESDEGRLQKQWPTSSEDSNGGKNGADGGKRWDESDPIADLKLGGVPSMPLMPAPALQLLPPPDSPAFLLNHFAHIAKVGRGSKLASYASSATGSSDAGSTANSPSVEKSQLLDRSHSSEETRSQKRAMNRAIAGEALMVTSKQFAFQVVQTPGGTARPGWWIPTSVVEGSSILKSDGAAAATSDRTRWQGDAFPSSRQSQMGTAYFQPSYRTFSSDEFAALASAAAFNTAALTTKISRRPSTNSQGQDDKDDMTSLSLSLDSASTQAKTEWTPLAPHQQEQIAAQLRAWAGLEGPERQAEARKALEERKVQLLEEAAGSSNPEGTVAMNNMSIEEVSPSAFFPPDFASHFQAQLQALAEGYYERLHREDLDRSQYAATLTNGMNRASGKEPSRKRGNPSLAVDRTTDSKSAEGQAHAEQVLREAVQSQDDREYGMPGSAYSNANRLPALPPGQDPMQLIAAASGAAGLDVRSSQVRDQLLQFAHNLYSTGSTVTPAIPVEQGADGQKNGSSAGTTRLHPTLLPLLHTLHGLHPKHLPTLLLLSCAYYTAGDLPGSLWYNNLILRLDPQYVEAMSNIGTTLRSLGRWREAESWWWRAIRLRPGYWDAYENLLGVLCSPKQEANGSDSQSLEQVPEPELPSHNVQAVEPQAANTGPRFHEALQLCEFVEQHITGFKASGNQGKGYPSPLPIACPVSLPPAQVPRLQNLFYGKGNLKYVIPEYGPVPAATEYEHAVEVVISPHPHLVATTRDLVVAACTVCVLTLGVEIPGFPGTGAAFKLAQALGLDLGDRNQASLVATGNYTALHPSGILALVSRAGNDYVRLLLRFGAGHLPTLLVLPKAALQLTSILFAETNGVLPSLAASMPRKKSSDAASLTQATEQTNMTTSTVLLTLAKLYQDATASPAAGQHGALTLRGISPSISLMLPLYYLSLSLHPSASTCNNLGILLSSIPTVATVTDTAGDGKPQQVNGQSLAMQYYSEGLRLDASHPHLYTNLGSLLKDLGHLNDAIKMYEKAVECNPTFDVALANLGNAIKDQGRTQDSVAYYRRAVEVNPNFPEALCGLVNALLAVCDWREVYEQPQPLMTRVGELVDKQLTEGCHYGAGTMQLDKPLQTWLSIILNALGDVRPETQTQWMERLQVFFVPIEQRDQSICEGSFVIRLTEFMLRKLQRRWYLDLAVRSQVAGTVLRPTAQEAASYPRPLLPSRLIAPAVPTVLPFHTFTYPLSARQIRLISHRNALRISQTTLTQMWVPSHVYPPPPLPVETIKVGYISSDFNNHPLAHLMQSCFGFHDLSRFSVHLYATTASDQSPFRQKIEREAQHFLDVSRMKNETIIDRIVQDGIHILINLNGYTKGARNEIFAARPCPVQMEFMGFAGPLVAGWIDWVIADPIVCPPSYTSGDVWRKIAAAAPGELQPTDLPGALDPEGPRGDWIYSERFIYMPHTYFVNDHKQGFRETENPSGVNPEEEWRIEEEKRWSARKELFPNLPDDYIIFADFNQLYKCEPTLFRLWLRILARVPNSILWLLRFPASGEPHLLASARQWAGDEVASRVIFTDVAPKHVHIQRGRIADLFLDTTECNAHTTAADILWSGTPVLTWPKHMHKMCSRVAASIVTATGLEAQLVVDSEQAYEDRAVELAKGVAYDYVTQQGHIEPPVAPPNSTITADALAINTSASSAVPHGGSSASQTSQSGAAPVSKQAVDTSSAQVAAKKAAAEVTAPSKTIRLACGPQAPPHTTSRRGKNELSDLRKQLFLTREQSRLFDTRAWVRALERGYAEAWRRWVAGTDCEDSPEWQALPPDAPEKISSHIWLNSDERTLMSDL